MAGKKNNRKNVVRNASNRPSRFYFVLGAIAVVGASILGYTLLRKPAVPVGEAVAVDPSAPGGASQGYTRGNPDAPVHIIEFADFECPGCAQFATVTEPDVKTRIVDAGLARFTFYDFPLPQHRNSQPAHNAAACADDQGRFWEMHDRIFQGQDQWNTQAASNPKPFFERYAAQVGLNVKVWETCYDQRKHQGRLMANMAEGERRRVSSTPTFIIGDRMYPGALPYDMLKAAVDSAVAAAAAVAPAAAPAPAG
ncbi:MAG: DsbA family protein [Gemmatimonadaceae bacterium]